jgi:cobyrinic acid a,c-diamide synthase
MADAQDERRSRSFPALVKIEQLIPPVVIAAPSSGSGKTTVATELMAALRRRGSKVGPGYIDPGCPGRGTSRDLDPVLVGEDMIAPLFMHGARPVRTSRGSKA